jgi:hypothetical protein
MGETEKFKSINATDGRNLTVVELYEFLELAVTYIRVRGPISVTQTEEALKMLGVYHPLLKCEISNDKVPRIMPLTSNTRPKYKQLKQDC